ncbi:MAG: SDR family oxidoreductase [Fimbriimonadaceae bacterium]|nr:SDR family oxidoreductase [Alphaproteobacteria bacterium]
MTETVSGKRVFVTGGAKGIGRGIVCALAEEGYDITFSCHGSGEDAEQLVDELSNRHSGIAVDCVKTDLRERAQVDDFADLIASCETLYGLVHNAGNSYDSLAALVDQDRAESLFQLNFWSMTRLVAAASRPMMRAKQGRIVGIGSITGQFGAAGNSIYASSKGAMLSYIKTLSVELARKGVTANYVAPGFVDTHLQAPYAAHRDKIEELIPLGRFAQPEEIGGLVRYLLSPLAGYITGCVIPIDGGVSAGLSVRP